MSEKLTDRDALTSVASGDLLHIVDVSDTTDSAEGTSKKITQDNLIPDASATVKGKVELATDAETTTGTDTARAITPSNLTSQIGSRIQAYDADLTTWAGKTAPSGTVVGTTDTQTLSSKTLEAPVVKAWTGWQLYDTVTPTYTSADDPTYTITFAAVDLTSVMSVGMKVKFTNNSTTFYGIITAIAFSTNTVVTLYGGTDYDVANSAISAFYFSTDRCPQGFPMDPTKWTVEVKDTTDRSASGTGTAWNNVGGANAQITIPIGAWHVSYQVSVFGDRTTAGTGDGIAVTLSTANNTASDGDLTSLGNYYGSGVGSSDDIHGGMAIKTKFLVLAAKTLYYLNAKMDNNGTWYYKNSTYGSMVLRAVSAYL